MDPIFVMATQAMVLLVFVAVIGVSSAQTSLSEEDKQLLLNLHNNERSIVNPSASNMESMVWNDELAAVAQAYAQRCVYEHNDARSSQAPSFSYVGENIAASTAATNYRNLFSLWANEKQDYTYSTNRCSAGAVCGHYTQIVWATSNNLGCGAYRCANLQGAFRNGLYLVCNYGPGGNIRGQQPYRGGTSCSRCPQDKPNCSQGLCTDRAGSAASNSSSTAVTPSSTAGTTSGSLSYYFISRAFEITLAILIMITLVVL